MADARLGIQYGLDDVHPAKLRRAAKKRPALDLRFYEVEGARKQYYWQIFRKYHYLSHDFNKSSKLILCECNGTLCGFAASLPIPQGFHPNLWKAHRIVVLPDHQGVGIGNALTTFVAEEFTRRKKDYTITTSNPSMIMALKKNPRWACTFFGRKKYKKALSRMQAHFDKSQSNNRVTAKFMFKKRTLTP